MTEFFETDDDRILRDKITRALEAELEIPVRRIDIFKFTDSMGDPAVRIEVSFRLSKRVQDTSLLYRAVNIVGRVIENVDLPYPAVILPYLDKKQKLAESA